MKKIILITILCCLVSWPVQAQEASALQSIEGTVWAEFGDGEACGDMYGSTALGFFDGTVYKLQRIDQSCDPYCMPGCCWRPDTSSGDGDTYGYLPTGLFWRVRFECAYSYLNCIAGYEIGILSPASGKGVIQRPPVLRCLFGVCAFIRLDSFTIPLVLDTTWSFPEDVCGPRPPRPPIL
jgi:hypothetical protein